MNSNNSFTTVFSTYSSSLQHLTTLLASCDMQVVLSVLNLLYVFSKRSNYITRLGSDKRTPLLARLQHLAEVHQKLCLPVVMVSGVLLFTSGALIEGLCCVELGRKGERLWSGRVLQGSAHDCKTSHAPALHSLGIVEWTRIFTGCFCATEIPSECHNAALWVLRRARSWGQVGEKGEEQDLGLKQWLKQFGNVVLICLCSIWTPSPADQ